MDDYTAYLRGYDMNKYTNEHVKFKAAERAMQKVQHEKVTKVSIYTGWVTLMDTDREKVDTLFIWWHQSAVWWSGNALLESSNAEHLHNMTNVTE